MGKQLILSEKPSVARDIAAALGGFEDQGEYLESDDYVLAWAVGHLLELSEPQDYDTKLKSWSIKNLPIIPEQYTIKPRDGQKKRLTLLRRLGRRKDVTGLINACDAGREGEMIFRRIVEYTGLDKKPIQRLWLQSLTDSAIHEAFASLRPGEELETLADAAWLRGVGDWLVGMNATRALTQRLKSRGEKGSWSAGRVQSPTLNLLVKREREILAHRPRPYWEVVGSFSIPGQAWEGSLQQDRPTDDPDHKPTRFFDKDRVDALVAGLSASQTGQASEKRKRSKQRPPLPFDLTSLQREANRRFSFSAKRTLDAAQRLYEGHKLITYPRTDSRHLPEDYEATVRKVLDELGRDVDFAEVADKVAAAPQNLDTILDSSKVSDHFAIVPTGGEPTEALRSDDARVYELVVRQFLASLMGPATWATVERWVEVELDGEVARFKTTARTLEELGFQEALGAKLGEEKLPPLVPGQTRAQEVLTRLESVVVHDKETRPPGHYTEAQLLRMMETAGERVDDEDLSDAMEGRGLGTPATRAEIIEGLIRRTYARRVDGRLACTSKAIRLMDVLERLEVPYLASPALTGEWEYRLGKVQRGEMPRAELQAELESFTRQIVDILVGFDHDQLYADEPSLGTCPACGEGVVVETSWGYRCTLNTSQDSPCNLMIWKDRFGRYVDRGLVRELIEQRDVGPIKGFVDRSGRSIEGTLHLEFDEEKERWILRTEFGKPSEQDQTPEEVRGVLCPDPEDPSRNIVETNHRYVSERLLEGEVKRAPLLPRVVCHREIEPDEAMAYFSSEGRTDMMDGFISKRGRPFRGLLYRKETGRHGFEFPPREPRNGKAKPKAKKKPATRKRKTTTSRTRKKKTASAS